MIEATVAHATIGELLEVVFSVQSVLRLYKGVSLEPAVRE
jgi:hypothetical protein